MKSKKLWILLALLVLICGICAIQFRTNLVASEKTSNDKSITDDTKAIETNPDDPNVYRRGKAHLDSGDYDKAIADFTKAIELNPEDHYRYLYRALAYFAKDDFVKAISDYTKAIEINPKDSYVYLYRGKSYSIHAYEYGGKNDYDKAIADYTKAIELNPDEAPYIYIHRGTAYFNRGSAFATIDDYDLAIIDITKAIEFDPKSANAYYSRGNAYGKKGEYDRAISDYTKALEINPKYFEAYRLRGVLYAKKGEYDRAISDLTEALKINPKDHKAYWVRAIVYGDKGQFDKAIADLNKAIELDPKYADAYYNRGLNYYNRGLNYYVEGDYDKAREDIRKAQSLGKKVDPEVLKEIREASQAASYFTLGSHKDDVLRAQGTPDANIDPPAATDQWEVFETTSIDGWVKKVKRGTIFKTTSGNIYEVADFVILFEMEVSPNVTVLTNGRFYKLFIRGVDEPLMCKKLNRSNRNTSSGGGVIEATIIGMHNDLLDLGEYGVFSGLQHGNIYRLSNGQIWEQTDFYIYIYIAVMPKVTIWQNGPFYNMKVEGIDKAVTVRQLK